ncbi:hypothetical protein NMY22_g4129 [Coprinellus aureogranulatus]|nr:hypothetical protein NMY22_g4129 [Coprinellus aureogranulatus]
MGHSKVCTTIACYSDEVQRLEDLSWKPCHLQDFIIPRQRRSAGPQALQVASSSRLIATPGLERDSPAEAMTRLESSNVERLQTTRRRRRESAVEYLQCIYALNSADYELAKLHKPPSPHPHLPSSSLLSSLQSTEVLTPSSKYNQSLPPSPATRKPPTMEIASFSQYTRPILAAFDLHLGEIASDVEPQS